MREAARKGLFTVVAAGGVLAAGAGYAQADAAADGSATGSAGVASGNSVQVPVHVPVNACGNTATVIGLLNPATGNLCGIGLPASSSASESSSGTSALGDAAESPGVASGNEVQVPVDAPVNACGNTATVIGLLNSADTNGCGAVAVPEAPEAPGTEVPGAEVPQAPQVPQVPVPELPQTPATPAVPQVPPAPQVPEAPAVPETPASPSAPQVPATPSASQTPNAPDAPDTPDSPDTPESPNTPESPDSPAGPSNRTVQAHEGGQALAETGSPAGLEVVAPVGAGLLLGGLVLYRRFRSAGR